MNSTMFLVLVAIAIILIKCLDTLVVKEMKSVDDTQKGGEDENNNQQQLPPQNQQRSISGNGEMNNQANIQKEETKKEAEPQKEETKKEEDKTENKLRQRESKLIAGLIEPASIASNMLLDFKKAVGANNLVETKNTTENFKGTGDKQTNDVFITTEQETKDKIIQAIDVKDPDISVLKIPLKSKNNEMAKEKTKKNIIFKKATLNLKNVPEKDSVVVGNPPELKYGDKQKHRKEVAKKESQILSHPKSERRTNNPRKQSRIHTLNDSRNHHNRVQLHSRKKHEMQVHGVKRRGAKGRNRLEH